jgi:hypothetical protein
MINRPLQPDDFPRERIEALRLRPSVRGEIIIVWQSSRERCSAILRIRERIGSESGRWFSSRGDFIRVLNHQEEETIILSEQELMLGEDEEEVRMAFGRSINTILSRERQSALDECDAVIAYMEYLRGLLTGEQASTVTMKKILERSAPPGVDVKEVLDYARGNLHKNNEGIIEQARMLRDKTCRVRDTLSHPAA